MVDLSDLIAQSKPPSTNHGVEIGAVFVETWGYDQSNVDTYVVVEVTPTMVGIKPCGQVMVGNQVQPNPSVILPWQTYNNDRTTRLGKVTAQGTVRKRVSTGYRGDPWLHMTSYSGASLWDGERTYFDTIAAGYPGH